MSATLTVALPVLPLRAVLVLVHDRGIGSAGQVVELDPHVARQVAADLVQAADLAEARKVSRGTTRLALVRDIPGEREGS